MSPLRRLSNAPWLALLILVPALMGVPACGGDAGKADAGKAGAEGGAAKVEPGKAATTAEPVPTTTAPVAAAGEETDTGEDEPVEQPPIPAEFEQVGVAACDDYVKTYVACIDAKVPEADREAQRRVVFDNVTAWKQTASGGDAASKGLQTACKIATEQAKRETQAWDCGW